MQLEGYNGSSASSGPSQDTSPEALYFVAIALLDQVVTLLTAAVKTDDELSYQSKLIPGSTVGKHLRHVHDHFRLLLDSLKEASSSDSQSTLQLNYDVRSRNVAAETSHQAALDSFKGLKKRLEVETGKGTKVEGKRKVKLAAVTPDPVEMESTWSRELWFACLHSIHHYSLLRVVAAGELHLEIPKEFGVAPSTLTFRANKQQTPPKL